MSDSAESTKSIATTTQKYITTNKALQERLRAVEIALTAEQPTNARKEDDAEIDLENNKALFFREIVIREPKEEASPCQIENEVAFLTYIAKNHPSIPVPKIYLYDTASESNSPFIAMEFIEGQPLNSIWSSLSEPEKTTVVDQIAQIIVQMGDIDLGGIGDLTLEHALGPTVEGVKLFKGRDKFHSPACYDIGPHLSTHAYAVACYDKEIYYYTHCSPEDLDEDLFDEIPKSQFIAELEATRNTLSSNPTPFLPQEPFAIIHGDFYGRNIMVYNGHISAIIDWEFAGSYPLSELLGGSGVELFELEDENLVEYGQWSDRIRELVVGKATARGWDEKKIALLVGEGNMQLQLARREMVPMGDFDDEEGGAEVDEDDDDAVLIVE